MKRARSPEAKDQRRQVFLDAALDEFFERGFTATRMEDIARRAGFSKGSLYLYFSSKEDLFTALIDTVAVPNAERLEMYASASPDAREAIARLLTFAKHLIRDTNLPRLMKVLIADAGVFPDVVRGYRRQVLDRVLGVFASVLERGQKAGDFNIEDPQLTARLVVAPVVFSSIWRVVFEIDAEARVDLDALFALHERMLLRALEFEKAGIE